MATIDQRNAAFDAAKAEAIVLVRAIVTWPFEEPAEEKVRAKENSKYILAIVDAIIGASGNGRDAEFAAAKKEALELVQALATSDMARRVARDKINDRANAPYIYAIVDAVNHAVKATPE